MHGTCPVFIFALRILQRQRQLCCVFYTAPCVFHGKLWRLPPLCIPIISAYRGFKCTVFETTKKFIPTTEMTTKGMRWWLALHAGDGVDSYRFHQVFTYRECSDIISQQARFCTTGVSGRETQASSNRGPILCHYYPIPTHESDMSDALDEAVVSMAEALHKNKELMLIRFECIFWIVRLSLTVL